MDNSRWHMSIPPCKAYGGQMNATDCVQDISAIEQRIRELSEWLKQNAGNVSAEQRHLDEGTQERIYWHYGYMVAMYCLQATIFNCLGHNVKNAILIPFIHVMKVDKQKFDNLLGRLLKTKPLPVKKIRLRRNAAPNR